LFFEHHRDSARAYDRSMFKAICGAASFIAVVGFLAGCGSVSAKPDPDAAVGAEDGTTGCTMNAQCTVTGKPVCETTTMVCVACTASDIGACSGTTPVCGTTNTCQACSAHSDCASSVCLPDGSCGAETDVAFLDAALGTGTSCTRAMPCAQMSAALATNHPYVKVSGTLNEPVTLADRNVTFLAEPGAILKNTSGNGLTITGSSHVEIYDLQISNSGTGINIPTGTTVSLFLSRAKVQNNANGGIVQESGTLNVTRSTIASNTGAGGIFSHDTTVSVTASTISSNSGGEGIIYYGGSLSVSRSTFVNNINGGLYLGSTGTFAIVGNVFFSNGQTSATTGGIFINTTQNAGNRLELNTFVGNRTNTSTAPAIQCSAGTFTARSNIMSGNLGATDQFSGTCLHAYSISRPGAVPSGTGNLAGDPLFVDGATGNLHLQSGSPARGAGDPASDLAGIAALDIDGDMRATPPDMGADQFKQ
jgi:hypothetical protein